MSTPKSVVAALVATTLCASCSPGGESGDFLPGHSRPVLDHDWPHPSQLDFADSGFTPIDPESVLVSTPAGVRAYVIADAADPLVEVTAAIPLGRHFEGDGEAGASEAASAALRRTLSVRLGPDLVADTRVSQEGGVTRLGVEVLAEDWRMALAALVGTLRAPTPEALAVSASERGDEASAPRGTGRTQALAELTGLVASYPIGPPEPGVRAGSGAVRDLIDGAVRPESVVFGIGGGVDRAEAEAALVELTEGWGPSQAPRRDARPPTAEAARTPADGLHTVDVSGFMSWIALGHAMEAIAPEHEAAMALLEEVVNIRLNIATREIRGLTNRAMLSLPAATDGAGVLYLRASGRSESVGPLIRYSVEELARIRRADGAPTDEEMKQAKGGLALGWWEDSLDGARRTAATYAVESVRRGSLNHLLAWPDEVRAVAVAAVTEAGQRYIDPEVLTAVVVGQIGDVREALHPRWPTALHEVPSLLRPTGREP